MSSRARHAHRLASLLCHAASGAHVQLQYSRAMRRYRVIWTGGPDVATMREHARAKADEVSLLDIETLEWRRRDPASDPASRYDYGT